MYNYANSPLLQNIEYKQIEQAQCKEMFAVLWRF
jgi:hypothetical protein